MGKKNILVTGAAGFIGYHLINRLLRNSIYNVWGIDNLNEYYDINLKYSRLRKLGISIKNKTDFEKIAIQSEEYSNFQFLKIDIADTKRLAILFEEIKFSIIINLAAQAGVRYSIQNPDVYVNSNIQGFLNILENSRKHEIEHLIYASSSSVYGLNGIPFSEEDPVDHPISMYAVTKRTNELMAHAYSHIYQLPVTGLRFFTVYGPFGRPDMAPFLFTNAISKSEPINLFNYGDLQRDFTYIDDIVESIYRLITLSPQMGDNVKKNQIECNYKKINPASSLRAPFRLLNIGNDNPVDISYFISLLEKHLGKKAIINKVPMQDGDVKKTWADISKLYELTSYKPKTSIEEGVTKFIEWYKCYYCEKTN
ncbi:MAG: GDP-mannose 4,6-dehydratase [Bacteroidetes bacterium]|nr:GDP-mannose 4,6-dehydratase [Bacteroidota bacterium]